ncbi:MAG: phospholipid carrier-dependent glycosyltransferase [Phycisphaerales bacterium]|nr:phospholipid carrier-dependent glycosyltransferase [Phycisphaerales bacterium]
MFRLLAVFCIIFTVIYLLPLGGRPIVTPDESRYGAIPAEMLETGEWVAPRLNGIRYFEKPVLGYWAIAASQWLFGPSPWSIRFPSAVAMGFAALCLVLLARCMGLREEVGWLAAIVFLTMLGVLIIGTVAILDAMFTGAVTGALTFFAMAWTARTPGARFGWLLLFGAFCGLAFLVKGFLGLAIPTIVIGPFLLWMCRWREIFVLPWVPMVAAAIVIAPWGIAVHMADSEYWHYFFWVEHIHRFTGGEEAQHPEPFWFFGPILLASAIPWTFAAILVIVGLGRRRLREPWMRYALCWVVVPLLLFSISSGKLPSYIIPCMPAVALLIAVGLVERFEYRPERRTAKWLYPSVILMLFGVAAFVEWGFGFVDPSPWGEEGAWRFGLIGAGFFAWAALDLAAVSTTRANRRVLLMGLSPVLMFAFVPLLLPTNWMSGYKAPEAFLSAHGDAMADPEALVISDSHLMHAVNWLYGRYDVVLFGGPGEVAWGIVDHADRLVDGPALIELISRESRERPVVLLLRDTENLQHILAHPDVPEPWQLEVDRGIGLSVFGPPPS